MKTGPRRDSADQQEEGTEWEDEWDEGVEMDLLQEKAQNKALNPESWSVLGSHHVSMGADRLTFPYCTSTVC